MKTLIVSAAVMGGIAAMQATPASAGGIQIVFGGGSAPLGTGYAHGVGTHWHPTYVSYPGISHSTVYPSLAPTPHLHWHNTTHYDYIPGRYVRYGHQIVYIPGRYVLHQDGHWDVHH